MAFHSKGSSISRSSRTNHRDKESILGLSGWLFADLLLAIAVIFLVAQDKPSLSADSKEVTKENVAKLKGQVLGLETALAELEKSTPATEKSGLIASAEEQLTIQIPGGAKPTSNEAFTRRLENSTLKLGSIETTFSELKKANYKIGFVIWFARDEKLSVSTSRRHLGTVVLALNNMGLVLDTQFKPQEPGNFPNLSGYIDNGIGSDLKLRAFLFKSTK